MTHLTDIKENIKQLITLTNRPARYGKLLYYSLLNSGQNENKLRENRGWKTVALTFHFAKDLWALKISIQNAALSGV